MKKLLFGVCLLMLTTPAFSQVVDNVSLLTDRIDRLERDVTMLQRKTYQPDSESNSGFLGFGKKKTPSDTYAPIDQTDELYTKISSQETLIRDLTAQVEKQAFELSQLQERMDKMNADIDMRFKLMEKNAAASAEPVKTVPAPQTTAKATGSDQEQYDAAYTLLKKGDHIAAERAFIEFIQKNPKSSLAGNANYWLGETYYARGQYEQAVGVFAEGFTTYKNNSKAPDNLLKLGMSMAKLNKKKEACTAFNSLPEEFPKASASLKTRAKEEAKKLSCS